MCPTGTQSCWNRQTRRSRFTATGTPRTTTSRRGTKERRLETPGRTKLMTLPNGRRHWRRTKATWRGWRGTRASKNDWTLFSVSIRAYILFLALKDNSKHLKRDGEIKEQKIEILKIYHREFLKNILFFFITYITYLSIAFARYKLGIQTPRSSIVLLVCIKRRSFLINKVC